jgi:hypothetical protein
MGIGHRKPKHLCISHQHHWMRSGWRKSPVGLETPLPTDFCYLCRITRKQLDDWKVKMQK